MSAAPQGDPSLEALLDFLKRSRGIDLTGYKPPSLERRFRRRLEIVGCRSFGDYLDYLEVSPEEYERLFDTLLINVTDFFRDPPAWERLAKQVLPELLASVGDDDPIRVWSAGCASGQEAYTIAMLMAEALGIDAHRERVKIYATDIDEDALGTARQGIYTADQLESVPDALRERYFERDGQRYAFRKDLRRTVIFGRNDLVADAPISRLDLLLCRNTLMYFSAETQARIVRHFHFALRPHGSLMLGKSEMLLAHRDLFTAVDLRHRIFARSLRSETLQTRLADLANGEDRPLSFLEDERVSRDVALDLGPQAQLIVSRAGLLTFANLPARALFGLSVDDFGRSFFELQLARRPAQLRQPIEEALREQRRVVAGTVTYTPEQGQPRRMEIVVNPLVSGTTAVAVSVVFEDVTRSLALRDEVDNQRTELEQAYEELQSTIDELETTNEELQSANEELQSANEELQTTNEELETMNEELQSTNEELETMNDELRDRTTQLNEFNDFFEAVLTSLGLAVAVVDAEQRVQIWNRGAEDLWGLREDEVLERHFMSLDMGLPTEALGATLRAVAGGADARRDLELEAVNRRGRSIMCATTVLPLPPDGDPDGDVHGAVILMHERAPGDGDGAPPAEGEPTGRLGKGSP